MSGVVGGGLLFVWGVVLFAMAGVDLGDERVNKRGKRVLEALAANPQASINAACQGWNETMAADRFFDNAGVSPGQLLAPHREATLRRMREQPTALVVQDTTELDFTAHPLTRRAACGA